MSDVAARRVQVHPANGRIESGLVLLVTLLVICGTLTYAWSRPEQGGQPELLDWQLNAFQDLGPVDQSIHSALVAASEEIAWTYQDFAVWPTIDELRDDHVLPPFHRDAFWRQNGEVEWELQLPLGEQETAQGATIYFGHSGKAPDQSAYLMLHRHSHAGYNAVNAAEIWIHPDPDVTRPSELKAESLVRNGWRQVVTYSGADEVNRLRG